MPPDQMTFEDAVHTIRSQSVGTHPGQTLAELSANHLLMVVFLRHSGCTFCREALSDVAKVRSSIEAGGMRIAFVHMSSPERGNELLRSYGLDTLPHFSDPQQVLYRAFELSNGTFQQLLGPKVFWEGVKAALLRRHGFGLIDGNGLRLPGVFILRDGKILLANRLPDAATRPDYLQMACDISDPASPDHSIPGLT